MINNIKIFGQNYDIHLTDRILGDEFRIGEVDYISQTIHLLEGLHVDQRNITLWHEIIHIILNQLGFEESVNEHLIDCLSTGIYQVLKDNTMD